MVAGVYGELTADGASVIVMATGDSWEIDRAAAALRRMTPVAQKTSPPGALRVPCTWAAITQLGHSFRGEPAGYWLPGPRLREWITTEFCRRHQALPPCPGIVPEGLQARPYQLEAATAIGFSTGFLLFDDPGTGKTPSSILGLATRRARGLDIFPMVIVVPSWDIADVWARHIALWAPSWPDATMYGGESRKNLDPRDPWLISVTTYATARLDAADMNGPLVRLKPAAVVADEVHLARNVTSQQSRALRRIAAHAGLFVGLTGTPVTRDTGDIYPVLAAMDPASWPSRQRFIKRYVDTTDTEYDQKVEGLKAVMEPEFRMALAGQYRRVAKADVLDQLPPKVYSVRRVAIPPEWRACYDQMERDMLAELPDGGELEVMSVLAQLTRLSQLASSACDVAVTEVPDEVTGELRRHYDVTLTAPSWKADALLEVLAERPGQPVAVFTVSSQLAAIAGAACEQAGYRTGYVTGSQGRAARTRAIDGLQAGELDVIACTAGAAGLGITLTAAGTAVFLQRSWQLDLATQPEDRLARIGQKHDMVEIIDVIAKDTVDSRVREVLRAKSGQLAELVRDPRIAREILGGLR